MTTLSIQKDGSEAQVRLSFRELCIISNALDDAGDCYNTPEDNEAVGELHNEVCAALDEMHRRGQHWDEYDD